MGRAAATRDRILASGLDVMSQYGLGGVTLGVLAERVGMSKSGLFAHFKSKDEVRSTCSNIRFVMAIPISSNRP
jgi:AcrR family transcriptional regulator